MMREEFARLQEVAARLNEIAVLLKHSTAGDQGDLLQEFRELLVLADELTAHYERR
jgi:hypothetical protein